MIFWHVFACRPGKERAAAIELGRRGLLPLVPVLPIKFRQGNRYWRPLALPGYVLVQIDGPTPKVLRQILSFDFQDGEKCVRREIGRATAKQMLAFLQFIESLKEVLTVKHSVKPGDRVSLKYGAWAGMKTKVEARKDNNLLIDLFHLGKTWVREDAVQLEDNTTTASNSLHKESKSGTRLEVRRGPIRAAGGQSRL
jgi:transcription antitermination factor NusG